MTAHVLRPRGLADAAAVHAALRPDGPAVVAGSARLTWSDLEARVDGAIERLVSEGVRPGDRVAMLAVPSVESVVLLHSVARLGAVAAPLGTRLTPAELSAAAGILGPLVVVHDQASAGKVQALAVPTLALGELASSRGSSPSSARRAGVPVEPSAPAVAVGTSGTTGRPRVAVLSHGALAASADAWTAFLPPASGWLLCLGLAHVAGLGVVWRAAMGGVPVDVVPEFEAGVVLAALRADAAATHVSLVPTQLARLLDVTKDPAPGGVRAVLLGGGVIPPALVTRALDAGWPVVPTYGLTETASGATALPTVEAGPHPESAGWPLPGVELRIERAAPDGVGDILVRTASLFSGYLGDAAATRAAFTPDGWLRTGDLGRLDEAGRLVVVDRRTDLIVSGGENVAPAEVESVLVEHPSVADAGVIGRTDETWGAVPVAAIVLAADGDDPTDDELVAFCRARLASYKVPIAFVRVALLPRTSSGKLQRARLREQLLAEAAVR
jgi:O-succinylbenzoic acid--CoA ligase